MSSFDAALVDFGFCLDERFSHSSFFWCVFGGESLGLSPSAPHFWIV